MRDRKPDKRKGQGGPKGPGGRPRAGARPPRPRGAGRFERAGERRPSKGPVRDPARDRVAHALAKQVQRWPDLDLDALDIRQLDAKDAAFAQAIYDRAIRRWLTLQWMIESQTETPWEKLHPRARGALLSGATQLALMDRVPPRAAVFESVEWAKKQISDRSGGLINAILRGIDRGLMRDENERLVRREGIDPVGDAIPMEDGRSIALNDEYLPQDPIRRLSITTSHPPELLRSWVKWFGMAEATRLAMHGLSDPPTILNIAHAKLALPDDCHPHSIPGHAIWRGSWNDLNELLSTRRDVWVQDPSASLAVTSVADLKPKLVIDLCAGLGTKTRQLAATFPDAEIIATDIDRPRLAVLKQSLGDTKGVKVVAYDETRAMVGKADLVLLDVPCSNTGVLARRVEARYRWSNEREESLHSMQRQLIADTLPLLTEGPDRGAILYSTCSLSPAENEDIVRWAAKWHSLEIEREHRREPTGGPGADQERYSDGGYAALLR